MPDLPPPRTPGHYAIGLVCLGNICRSPIGDVVLNKKIADAGLADSVTVASCGTGDWHVGQPMDRRAAAVLTTSGYDATRHRAQQFNDHWHERFDLLLAMDSDNLADIGSTDRARLFRDFDPQAPGADVPDPYYGGDQGFADVLEMIERTADVLVHAIDQQLG